MKNKLKRYPLGEIFLYIIFFSFSFWLMFSTFSYAGGQMYIAAKSWSDFSYHIPFIRSFSFGNNFPPQEPLFAGEYIHYHFLFYLLVGLLEKAGLPIDYALNIPSFLGFFGLLIMLYLLAKKLFNSKAVALLSILFFLFNGSLSFLEFFKKHPLSPNTVQAIITNNTFPSFGPYDGNIVSAFWNLNIYTNQRHLAAAYALSFALVYFVLFHSQRYDKDAIEHLAIKYETPSHHVLKKIKHVFSWREIKQEFLKQVKQTKIFFALAIGIVLGLSFFFHLAVFLMTVIVLCCMFIFFRELRLAIAIILFTGAIIVFPQYMYLQSGDSTFHVSLVPGYLIFDHFTFQNFLIYWFYNLGLHFILIPIGFFLAPRTIKKLFVGFFALFVVGNLFQFSPEIAGNHKFFNFFLLIGNMLSAYTLIVIWRKSMVIKPLIVIVTLLLIFSGIIDFFPIYNDAKITLPDYPKNPDEQWIMKNTPPHAVFLNTNYLYDTASLAGRKIFLGWPYFPWSEGFDTTTRSTEIKAFLSLKDTSAICHFLTTHHLDYVELTTPSDDFPFDSQFWQISFSPIYKSNTTDLTIYKTTMICPSL